MSVLDYFGPLSAPRHPQFVAESLEQRGNRGNK